MKTPVISGFTHRNMAGRQGVGGKKGVALGSARERDWVSKVLGKTKSRAPIASPTGFQENTQRPKKCLGYVLRRGLCP